MDISDSILRLPDADEEKQLLLMNILQGKVDPALAPTKPRTQPRKLVLMQSIHSQEEEDADDPFSNEDNKLIAPQSGHPADLPKEEIRDFHELRDDSFFYP